MKPEEKPVFLFSQSSHQEIMSHVLVGICEKQLIAVNSRWICECEIANQVSIGWSMMEYKLNC